MSKIPKLRFKEFSENWEEKKLSQFSKIERGKFTPRPRNNPIYYNGNIPFVQTSDVVKSKGRINLFTQTLNNKGLQVSKLFTKGTILITIAANIGYSGILEIDMACPDSLIGLTCDDETYNVFLNYLLEIEQPKMDYLAIDNAQKNINIDFLKPYKFQLPMLEEQKKIASFLTSIDKKIEQLSKKESLLKEYKKGVMQKLFNQEIRFKADDGSEFCDWEEVKLGKLLKESKVKSTSSGQYEVLSSTKDNIVLQSEYFNREIASKDNTGYKILKVNQLVFSPQNLWMGNINVNTKYNVGIVSPSYKIYDFKQNLLVDYGKYFLKTSRMMYEYGQASEQGASVVRRSLNIDLFNSIKVSLPCVKEQNKIANFLSSIDTKLEQVQKQLEQAKEFKKALLQQMFV